MSFKKVLLIVLLGTLAGCASSPVSNNSSRDSFREGRYAEVSDQLVGWLKEHPGDHKDILLIYLTLGLSYHHQGNYEKSILAFREAENLAELKDYTSLTEETAAILSTERLKQYKGEDYERLMIVLYQVLNYAGKGDFSGALVEVRKLNSMLYRYRFEGKRDYPDFALLSYLSGFFYEMQGDWDNAYISYLETNKRMPEFTEVGVDLWRTAHLSKRWEEKKEWAKKYDISSKRSVKDKRILAIVQEGLAPLKIPNPSWEALPTMLPVSQSEPSLSLCDQSSFAKLMDVQALAVSNLDQKFKSLIIRRAAGAAVKVVTGAVVNQKTNSGLGTLLTYIWLKADQADTRGWDTLPRSFRVLSVWESELEAKTLTLELENKGRKMSELKIERPLKTSRIWSVRVP